MIELYDNMFFGFGDHNEPMVNFMGQINPPESLKNEIKEWWDRCCEDFADALDTRNEPSPALTDAERNPGLGRA